MIFYNKDENEIQTNIMAGIDIGYYSISCFVAKIEEGKPSNLIAFATTKNLGMDGKNIVSYDRIKSSIKKVIDEVSNNSGIKITEVFVSSSLFICNSIIKTESTEIPYGRIVSDGDLKNVFKKLPLNDFENEDNKILHIIPVSYKLDGNFVPKSPLNMYGSQLQIKYNIIWTNRFALQNVTHLVKSCMVDVKGITSSGYSSGLACMNCLQFKNGTHAVIDIGSNKSLISVFMDQSLLYLGTLPYGSDIITRDIASALNTTKDEAERIKISYGSTTFSNSDYVSNIDILSINENGHTETSTVSKGEIVNIIRLKTEDILNSMKIYLNKKNILQHANKIIITGGGVNLKGFEETAIEIFEKPISFITYNKFEDTSIDAVSNPASSALFGLIEYKKANEYDLKKNTQKKNKIADKIKNFWENNFN